MILNNCRKLQLCVGANILLTCSIIAIVFAMSNKNNGYMRIGPQPDLQVLNITINTWTKYILFQLCVLINQIIDLLANDIGSPIVNFTIFNPDKKVIVGYGRTEIQVYGNTMWLCNSLREVFGILILVSQVDMAILRVLYSETTSIFTIYYVLKDKQFIKEGDDYELV